MLSTISQTLFSAGTPPSSPSCSTSSSPGGQRRPKSSSTSADPSGPSTPVSAQAKSSPPTSPSPTPTPMAMPVAVPARPKFRVRVQGHGHNQVLGKIKGKGKERATPSSSSSSRRPPNNITFAPVQLGKRLSAVGEEESSLTPAQQVEFKRQLELLRQEEEMWSDQYWVTLQDLKTQAVFFANPSSGACSWLPPNGVYVLPIPSGGQWWELSDPSRDGLCYYYHTKTKETRWTRPDTDLVIPLSSIQINTLYSSQSRRRASSPAISAVVSPSSSKHRPRHRSKLSAPPTSFPLNSSSLTSGSKQDNASHRTPRVRTNSAPTLSKTPEAESSPRRPKLERLRMSSIGSPTLDLTSAQSMSPIGSLKGGPVVVGPTINTKRFSHGHHPLLPVAISEQIREFGVKEFADTHFSKTYTQGGFLFRRKVSVERMMAWQKAAITAPLLSGSSSYKSSAVKIFKIIQHAMGERDRSVDVPILVISSSAGSHNGGLAGPAAAFKSSSLINSDRNVVLKEIQWMLSVGVASVEMRDETYCQIVKQLTDNPNFTAVFKGWELLCAVVVTFSPSKNFSGHLRSFIKGAHTDCASADELGARVAVMAKHCLDRLSADKPPKGKAPTILEIESAMGAAFNPSVFGSTIEQTMAIQAELYGADRVPIVLPFLANAILALGGITTEGVFRVPGDMDSIAMLKDRIDRGQYQLNGIDDPNVPASVFKLWLRELQAPLIPHSSYNAALAVASEPDAICDLVRSLPAVNRDVVVFTVSFLQLLLQHQDKTKMNEINLATIFAPNLLRCPSDGFQDAGEAAKVPAQFINSGFERQFVLNLLRHLVASEIGDFIPEHGRPARPSMSRSSSSN